MFIVQGGYVSAANSKTLTVSKKANVLDKIPPRGPRTATGTASANTTGNNGNNNNNVSSSGEQPDKGVSGFALKTILFPLDRIPPVLIDLKKYIFLTSLK